METEMDSLCDGQSWVKYSRKSVEGGGDGV